MQLLLTNIGVLGKLTNYDQINISFYFISPLKLNYIFFFGTNQQEIELPAIKKKGTPRRAKLHKIISLFYFIWTSFWSTKWPKVIRTCILGPIVQLLIYIVTQWRFSSVQSSIMCGPLDRRIQGCWSTNISPYNLVVRNASWMSPSPHDLLYSYIQREHFLAC